MMDYIQIVTELKEENKNLKEEIARLRAELIKYKQYVLELDKELQTGESHVEIQG